MKLCQKVNRKEPHTQNLLHNARNDRLNVGECWTLVRVVVPALFHQIHEIGRAITIIDEGTKGRVFASCDAFQDLCDVDVLVGCFIGTSTNDYFLQDDGEGVDVALLSGGYSREGCDWQELRCNPQKL